MLVLSHDEVAEKPVVPSENAQRRGLNTTDLGSSAIHLEPTSSPQTPIACEMSTTSMEPTDITDVGYEARASEIAPVSDMQNAEAVQEGDISQASRHQHTLSQLWPLRDQSGTGHIRDYTNLMPVSGVACNWETQESGHSEQNKPSGFFRDQTLQSRTAIGSLHDPMIFSLNPFLIDDLHDGSYQCSDCALTCDLSEPGVRHGCIQ